MASVASDAPVVVLSGDVPLVPAAALAALLEAHVASGAAATTVTTVLENPSGYGRVVRDAHGHVARVVETKAPGDASPEELEIREVNAGIYCFEAAALRAALGRLGTDNAQGELYLPEVLALLREDGRTVDAHVVDDPAVVLGVNDRVQLALVAGQARERILEGHMRAGVTVVDPASTHVDADVRIGQDTVLEPGTVLRGATQVGERCVVGPQTTLVDCVLHDDVTVVHAYATGAACHDGVSVGPFAYLRPGAVLREKAKAGTFVEIKNSDIGPGAKVPHLSYVGDADVGPGTNLGAGTITANYDGRAKHRTTIGARVRSAVHVSFVAPVRVGDDAWTAAGSVITHDVPPGALGVARERQRNVEGYAARKGGRPS
jgi:bifunctional UDP-N-acetylglucosamine pyrophosphorylase/glucosamine-1-phosphate N-acetyltransferase